VQVAQKERESGGTWNSLLVKGWRKLLIKLFSKSLRENVVFPAV